MGEFSDLVNIRNDYYEYTDEVCELVKNETTKINESYLSELLITKLMDGLDNEYPLTNFIILRLTHNEIVNHITDNTFVNIRKDISDKIVTEITGKSAIKTYYSGDSKDIKQRRAMMNMINNYMYSMYLSDDNQSLELMESGILKALDNFKNSEESITDITVSSHRSNNPAQGIIFTITISINQ